MSRPLPLKRFFEIGLVILMLHDTTHAQPNGPLTPGPTAELPKIDVEKPTPEQYRNTRKALPKALEAQCDEVLKFSWIDTEKIWNMIREPMTELILLIISLVFAASTAWLKVRLVALRSKIGLLSSRVFDPFFVRPSHFDQYATNLIIIGESGSGKTTLVHALSGANEAKPDVATATMSTYTLVNEISIESDNKITRRLVGFTQTTT
jgi:ABC-type glutathione transport system ATPase component